MSEIKSIIKAGCKAFTSFVDKAGSRKFIILIIATHAMYIHLLDPSYWAMIALAWQGVQGGIDGIATYRNRFEYQNERIRPEPQHARDDHPGIAM